MARLNERLALGIDIGGTKIAAGVVDLDGRILAKTSRRSPTTSSAEVLRAVDDVVGELRAEYPVVAVGVGAAGFVDDRQATVLFSPHLAWRNEPLRDAVRRRVGLPVVVDNDANMTGWAEWKFGAAQNERDFVVVTLGTGIGGSLVVDGRPFRGTFGLAGEFGHMLVHPEGRACECGNRGCWEQYASGRALARVGREHAERGTVLGRRLLAAAEGQIEAISGLLVGEAAVDHDPEARAEIAEVGRWLGLGIANLAAALDPGIVVVGGGVSQNAELVLHPARRAFREQLVGRGYRAESRIVPAHLGPDAGLVGAADMARVRRRRRRRRPPRDARVGSARTSTRRRPRTAGLPRTRRPAAE